jgi:flagellar basal-body rod protein FlgG
MIDAIYIANTALRAQQQHLDVIANNVANVQTPGFKRSRVAFAELANIQTATDAAQQATKAVHGAGIEVSSLAPVFTDGDLRPSSNPLDIAIRGQGLFEVVGKDGAPAYTRAGELRLDRDGFLATASGLRLADQIQVPPDATDVRIGADGAVTARLAGTGETLALGQLELTRFAAPEALRDAGDNTYAATEAAGDVSRGRPGEAGIGIVLAGFVEVSNVDMVEEMTGLVLAQRAYQLNARVLQVSDQILETINNLRR